MNQPAGPTRFMDSAALLEGDLNSQASVRWSIAYAGGHILLWLILGLSLDYLLFSNWDIAPTIRGAVIVIALVALLRSLGWLVLVGIQASLFLREPGHFPMILDSNAFIYGVVALATLAVGHSSPGTRQRFSRWIAAQLAPSARIEVPTLDAQASSTNTGWNILKRAGMGLLVIVVVVLAALLLLGSLPIDHLTRVRWLQHSLVNDYGLWPGATVITIVIGLFLVLREAAWRQMTHSQGKLYLRCVTLIEYHRDLRLIIKRRMKQKRTSKNMRKGRGR